MDARLALTQTALPARTQRSSDISINLPDSFLKTRHAVHGLCQRIPAHPAFGGLLIEIDSAEVIPNLELLIDVAE